MNTEVKQKISSNDIDISKASQNKSIKSITNGLLGIGVWLYQILFLSL